jgi:hypothetical protein
MKVKKLTELRNQLQQKSMAASNNKTNTDNNNNNQNLVVASALEQGSVSIAVGKDDHQSHAFLPDATKKPYTPNNSVSSKSNMNNNSGSKDLLKQSSSAASLRGGGGPIRKETSLWSQPAESFAHYRVTGAFSEESLQSAMRQGAINKEGLTTLRKVGKIPEKVTKTYICMYIYMNE